MTHRLFIPVKQVKLDFENECIRLFGELNGEIISDFLRSLKFDIKKDRNVKITERRIALVNELKKKYGQDNILKAIKIWEEKKQLGIITNTTHGISYFVTITSNPVSLDKSFNSSTTKRNKQVKTKPPTVRKESCTPKPYERLSKSNYKQFYGNVKGYENIDWGSNKDEYKNWWYTCTCGTGFDSTVQTCTKCGCTVNWPEAKKAFLNV